MAGGGTPGGIAELTRLYPIETPSASLEVATEFGEFVEAQPEKANRTGPGDQPMQYRPGRNARQRY